MSLLRDDLRRFFPIAISRTVWFAQPSHHSVAAAEEDHCWLPPPQKGRCFDPDIAKGTRKTTNPSATTAPCRCQAQNADAVELRHDVFRRAARHGRAAGIGPARFHGIVGHRWKGRRTGGNGLHVHAGQRFRRPRCDQSLVPAKCCGESASLPSGSNPPWTYNYGSNAMSLQWNSRYAGGAGCGREDLYLGMKIALAPRRASCPRWPSFRRSSRSLRQPRPYRW